MTKNKIISNKKNTMPPITLPIMAPVFVDEIGVVAVLTTGEGPTVGSPAPNNDVLDCVDISEEAPLEEGTFDCAFPVEAKVELKAGSVDEGMDKGVDERAGVDEGVSEGVDERAGSVDESVDEDERAGSVDEYEGVNEVLEEVTTEGVLFNVSVDDGCAKSDVNKGIERLQKIEPEARLASNSSIARLGADRVERPPGPT